MIVVPASLRSDFIHMAGMTIHIALESTIHIVGPSKSPLIESAAGNASLLWCAVAVPHCSSGSSLTHRFAA